MFQALFDYFYSLIGQLDLADGRDLSEIVFQIGADLGYTIDLGNYLALMASIIMMVLIFVCCIGFIWKIIKVVGRLFTGA